MEKILKKKIVSYLNLNNLADKHQHGARSQLGTSTQLLLQYEKLLQQVVSGNNTDMTYLDFAKAFDKIDHFILKIKLRSLGIDGLTGRWLAHFLEDRSQAVKVTNQRSNWKPHHIWYPTGHRPRTTTLPNLHHRHREENTNTKGYPKILSSPTPRHNKQSNP